jgi:hypothetical protein
LNSCLSITRVWAFFELAEHFIHGFRLWSMHLLAPPPLFMQAPHAHVAQASCNPQLDVPPVERFFASLVYGLGALLIRWWVVCNTMANSCVVGRMQVQLLSRLHHLAGIMCKHAHSPPHTPFRTCSACQNSLSHVKQQDKLTTAPCPCPHRFLFRLIVAVLMWPWSMLVYLSRGMNSVLQVGRRLFHTRLTGCM